VHCLRCPSWAEPNTLCHPSPSHPTIQSRCISSRASPRPAIKQEALPTSYPCRRSSNKDETKICADRCPAAGTTWALSTDLAPVQSTDHVVTSDSQRPQRLTSWVTRENTATIRLGILDYLPFPAARLCCPRVCLPSFITCHWGPEERPVACSVRLRLSLS
jgi:hypothetical protein